MRKTLMLVAALGLASSACNKVTYINSKTIPTGKVIDETGRFFIFGLVGTKEIDATKLCPEGVSKVQSKFSFVDSLLSGLTIGLYTPRSYEISCGQEGAGQ